MLFKINQKSDEELRKSMGLKRASNEDYTKPMHKNLDSEKTVGVGGRLALIIYSLITHIPLFYV